MANASQLSSALPLDEELPASVRTKDSAFILPSDDLETFLAYDLSVSRIDQISHHLWMVGRPQPPRPLNLQIVLGRTIVTSTDASLHLVWLPGKIFIKPLPGFFFTSQFYDRYLHGAAVHSHALGLLFTYIALIPTELDFGLAREARLIPSGREWRDWKVLSRRLIRDYPGQSIYDHLSPRYKYGELRHSRLDSIYRYLRGDWLRGYSSLMATPTYGQFFAENIAILASVTVYIALVLTAMQVGLATHSLVDNTAFQRACSGFAVFSIVAPIGAMGLLVAAFVVIFSANWWRTALEQRKRFRHDKAGQDRNGDQAAKVELGSEK